jgi:hypothetical protein
MLSIFGMSKHWFLPAKMVICVSLSLAGATLVRAAGCVYVLDNGGTAGALNVSSASSVSAQNCHIQVNSSDPSGLAASGLASLSGTRIHVAGGYSSSGNSTIAPPPSTGGTAVPDPLGTLTAPNVPAACGQTNYNLADSSTATISPGVYCGGITVSGYAQLTLSPGIYILNGGGFNISGSASITGTNVMFFLTGQNGYTNAPLNVSGSATISLTAPSSGTYQSILFYQDRTATYSSTNSITSSAPSTCTGTFYFPTTQMTVSGTILTLTGKMVVWDLSVQDSAQIALSL